MDSKKTAKIASMMNKFLANYQVLYINARGFHWNIKGENFFRLHEKFEEIYTILADNIDEIAERILTLNHCPMHSYSHYLQQSSIKEYVNVGDGREIVEILLDSFKYLIDSQREIVVLAAENHDEGTVDLLAGYIREQEKQNWMLGAYLK